MSLLTSSHPYGNLYSVAAFEKFYRLLCFGFQIVSVYRHRKPNLFDFDDFLILFGFFSAFRLLEHEFAVVHYFADGRICRRRDFHQIEFFIVRYRLCLACGDDTQLFAVFAYKPNFSVPNFFVYLMFPFNCFIPLDKISRSG